MPREDTKQLRCSFCGKTQDQVARMIAGPGVCICSECVELCRDIIAGEDGAAPRRRRKARAEQPVIEKIVITD